MSYEITQPGASINPGEVLRPFDTEDPAPETPVEGVDPAPETPGVETTPIETEQAHPDLEAARKNMLRDFHAGKQATAERNRQLDAREREAAAREAALNARLAEYQVYDEFGRIVEADPDLAQLVAERVPRARALVGQKPSTDSITKELAATQSALAEIHLNQVDLAMQSAYPDWDDVKDAVEDTMRDANLLANVQNPRQLRAAYELAYRATTAGKTSTAQAAAAQKKIMGQVKSAAQAARIGGPAPAPPPPAEPSSFDRNGRLRSWTEIASDQRR